MTWILPTLALAPSLLVPQAATPKQKPGDKPPQSKPQDPKERPRFRPLPIPQPVIEERGLRRIVVDGSLAEWPRLLAVGLRDPRQVSGTSLGAYRGPNDVSGQVYMLWDEKHLFVAIQVIDDWHRPMPKDAALQQEVPPVDNVQITFDPRRDTTAFGADPGREEDRTFFFADIERTAEGLIVWDRYRGTRNLTVGATSVVSRRDKDNVTIYEARIPWKQILPPGDAPRLSYVFDMQVEINDFDDPLDDLPQTRVGWNFGMGPKIAPGLWGSAMLVKTFDPERDKAPKFPSANPKPYEKLSRADWLKLYRDIHSTKPVFATAATPDPAMIGGPRRHELLLTLDAELAKFPRLDYLAYQHRTQRRMSREVAGYVQEGLPFFWQDATTSLLRKIKEAPPAKTVRLFRLPHGGWYVRSPTVNFAMDATGFGVEQLYIQRGIDFAVHTRPTEVTRRSDLLLIRMAASKPKRQFFTHIDFHLTGIKPGTMPIVKPFVKYAMIGLESVTPIGKITKEGKVTMSCGYLMKWKDGLSLLNAGLSLTQVEVKKMGIRPDILIVSAQHQFAVQIAKDVNARYTILDDVFLAHEYPERHGGRLRYETALRVQSQMKPLKTLILAPGESVDLK